MPVSPDPGSTISIPLGNAEAISKKTQSLIQRLEDGQVQLGDVVIDEKARSLSFPAQVNMREGPIEYALVTTRGKVHESVLSTTVSPLQIHLAALLLDFAKPDGSGEPLPVAIEVEWETNGRVRREPLEKFIVISKDGDWGSQGDVLVGDHWVYSGSRVFGGDLAAEREGSVIAVIGDPEALLRHTGPTSIYDNIHSPNADSMPPEGMPVRIHIHPGLKALESNQPQIK